MKKCNKTINIFTFIFLFVSFLLAPVNLVMADEASSEKTAAGSDKAADKGADKKKKEKGKGKGKDDEEEPDCE